MVISTACILLKWKCQKKNKPDFEVYKGLETALDKLFITTQQLVSKQPQVSRSNHDITINSSRFEPQRNISNKMKTTFVALALSLFGSTLAAPAAQATEPNPYPVSVGNLSLKHLIESDTYDFTFHATRRSPTGDPTESVICHTTW
jgi:hypothetical protein